MKTYLGDGVYAEYTGYSIILTTEDGIRVSNTIHLEWEVLEALNSFVVQAKARSKEIARDAREHEGSD